MPRDSLLLRSRLACVCLWAVLAAPPQAFAQDGWKPFTGPARTAPNKRPGDTQPLPLPPPGETTLPPAGDYQRPPPRGGAIERGDLDPIIASDGSGLPMDLWNGLDAQGLEGMLSGLDLPPRSPTLHELWKRMLKAKAEPPRGVPNAAHFLAVRLEALYRSGLLREMGETAGDDPSGAGAVVAALLARKDIGLGDPGRGCAFTKALVNPRTDLPERLRGEAQLLSGYCAAVAGDKNAAGLAVNLAREEGLDAELPLAILTGFAEDTKPRLTLPKRMLLLDYRFLALLGPVNTKQIVERAEPALLTVLAQESTADPHTIVTATDAALRINALQPQEAAEAYRQVSLTSQQAEADPAMRRAFYFRAAEATPAPPQRARFLRAYLDDARRGNASLQAAQVIATLLGNAPPGPDAAPLAEIGTEAMLAANRIADARTWAQAGPGGLAHWVALIDVIDPARRTWRPGTLGVMEDLALRGRLGADVLHRLATVLDALDIDVPVPLWDAAGRTPQPTSGYLPATGVLANLAESAKRKEFARTILLAMQSLGPAGADGANLLALGDTIRALRKIGLEGEARRLALEALMPVWPRLAQP